MKQELEHQLCKRFPLLFSGRQLSVRESLMSFGCECGDGWFRLIYAACLGLEEETKKLYPWWYLKLYVPLNKLVESWNKLMWKAPNLFFKRKTEFGLIPRFLVDLPRVPRFSQIKEKYGTLRLYMNAISDEMYEYLDVAEKASHNTCETCGKYGMVRGKSWLYCSCDEHAKEGDIERWEME